MNVIELKPKRNSRLASFYGQPTANSILIQRGMIRQYHDGQIEYTPGGKIMLAWVAARDENSPHREAMAQLFDAADESLNMLGNDLYNLNDRLEAGTDPAGDGMASEFLCTLFRLIAANIESAGYDIDAIV